MPKSQSRKPFASNKGKSSNNPKVGRKPFSKGKECADEATPIPGHNDWKWYAPSEAILSDVASLSFPEMLGNTYSMSYVPRKPQDVSGWAFNRIPGIMTLRLHQTLGAGKTATDATTVAARNIYTYVRHANSGHANYEAPDLFMYIIAHVSAQSWIETLKRVYGVMLTYTTRNRYFGQALVASMGFSYSDLSGQLADLRTFINVSSAKLNALKVPANLSVSKRWNWLAANYWLDEDSPKAQIYLPVFSTYFAWEPTASGTGTSLSIASPFQGLATLDDIKEFTNDLIERLYRDEDAGIMSGDIMKAYGDAVSQLSMLPAEYMCAPSVSTEVLEQFHNCIIFPASEGTYKHTVVQNGDGVIEEVIEVTKQDDTYFPDGRVSGQKGVFFDLLTDDLSPARVMVASRLIPQLRNHYEEGEQNPTTEIISCGSEIVVELDIVWDPTDIHDADDYQGSIVRFFTSSYEADGIDLGVFSLFTHFKHHPYLYPIFPGQDLTINNYLQPPTNDVVIGNINNYTIFDFSRIGDLHRVAILTLLNVM